MSQIKCFIEDTNGDAVVVQAAIIFPIIIMVFFAIVMLSLFIPQQTILREAAQVTAVSIATERSDTWVSFDAHANPQRVASVGNVYIDTIRGAFSQGDDGVRAENMARNLTRRGFVNVPGNIEVEYHFINFVIYQEVVVTLTQTIPIPINLSFIGFPTELVMAQEARAVVQNGDEFVRTIDLAADLATWLDNKFGISDTIQPAFDAISNVRGRLGF